MAIYRLDAETIGERAGHRPAALAARPTGLVPAFRRAAVARAACQLVNLPGFGASPPAEPLPAMPIASRKLCAILGTRPDIFGNGLGSFVALIAAARHGEQIGRIVLIGAAVAFPEPGRATFRALPKGRARGHGRRSPTRRSRACSPTISSPRIPDDRRRAQGGLPAHRSGGLRRRGAGARDARPLRRPRPHPQSGAGRGRREGRRDAAALGRALAERLPDARFVELPGVGHAPHIQAPDAVVATIAPFLGLAAERRGA